MINIIRYKDDAGDISGRAVLLGDKSDILAEYRILTRLLCDKYDYTTVVANQAGLAKLDVTGVITLEHIKGESEGNNEQT